MSGKISALGALLKKRRKDLKISQNALAKQMGWTTGVYISSYERGACEPPLNRELFDILQVDREKAWAAFFKDINKYFWSKV